jgi:hypothetical protein
MTILALLFLWLFTVVIPAPVPVPAKAMNNSSSPSVRVSYEYANASEPCATHIRVAYSWPEASPSASWSLDVYYLGLNPNGDFGGGNPNDLALYYIDHGGLGPMNKSVVLTIPQGANFAKAVMWSDPQGHFGGSVVADVRNVSGIRCRMHPMPARVVTSSAGLSIRVSFEYANASESCATHIRVGYSWPNLSPSVKWRAYGQWDRYDSSFLHPESWAILTDSGQGAMDKSVVYSGDTLRGSAWAIFSIYHAAVNDPQAGVQVQPEWWEQVTRTNSVQKPCRNVLAPQPITNH